MSYRTVDEVMTRELRTVTPDHSISEVREIFDIERFRHMPVVDADGLVGIISQTDLLRMMHGAKIMTSRVEQHNTLIFESTTVGEVMTRDVKTVESEAPVSEAARIMIHYKLNAVPVTEDGVIIGMLTSTDILREYIEAVR